MLCNNWTQRCAVRLFGSDWHVSLCSSCSAEEAAVVLQMFKFGSSVSNWQMWTNEARRVNAKEAGCFAVSNISTTSRCVQGNSDNAVLVPVRSARLYLAHQSLFRLPIMPQWACWRAHRGMDALRNCEPSAVLLRLQRVRSVCPKSQLSYWNGTGRNRCGPEGTPLPPAGRNQVLQLRIWKRMWAEMFYWWRWFTAFDF